jgi:hypothetical protein
MAIDARVGRIRAFKPAKIEARRHISASFQCRTTLPGHERPICSCVVFGIN